jgi:hypothetical protein
MTDHELKEKMRNNAYYLPLRAAKVERIIEMIDRLEDMSDISEMMRLTTTE